MWIRPCNDPSIVTTRSQVIVYLPKLFLFLTLFDVILAKNSRFYHACLSFTKIQRADAAFLQSGTYILIFLSRQFFQLIRLEEIVMLQFYWVPHKLWYASREMKSFANRFSTFIFFFLQTYTTVFIWKQLSKFSKCSTFLCFSYIISTTVFIWKQLSKFSKCSTFICFSCTI